MKPVNNFHFPVRLSICHLLNFNLYAHCSPQINIKHRQCDEITMRIMINCHTKCFLLLLSITLVLFNSILFSTGPIKHRILWLFYSFISTYIVCLFESLYHTHCVFLCMEVWIWSKLWKCIDIVFSCLQTHFWLQM